MIARWLRVAGAALFVICVPVALVGSNVRYLFGEARLYTFAVNRYAVPIITDIPKPELERAARELRAYLGNSDDLLDIRVTNVEGVAVPFFSEREILHMRDVKGLVQGFVRAQEVALIVIAVYIAATVALRRREGLRTIARLTWLTCLGFNIAAIGFGVTAALGFDALFTRFHTLSFDNDMWMLDPRRDHLVQLFPFEFWQISAGLLIGMTVLETALLAIASRWYLARAERPAQQRAMVEAGR